MKTENIKNRMPGIVLICLCLVASYLAPVNLCKAQGTAVNPTGAAPNASAMLDVNTTASPFGGVLIPRMTTAQRDAIASPAQSLMIYNTTTKCFEFFEYQYWQSMYCAASLCILGSSPANGGIAFLSSGGKCYIVATTDQSSSSEWGCSGTSIAGAVATAVGTGQANTTAIVNNCATAGTAAKICDNLILSGFSDWYLPSKDEFTALRPYITPSQGLTWTSTQIDATTAWTWWYATGYFNVDALTSFQNKSTGSYVRCIRSF